MREAGKFITQILVCPLGQYRFITNSSQHNMLGFTNNKIKKHYYLVLMKTMDMT